MKKITLIASVALLAMSVTSCKKDRYCNCKDDDDKTAILLKDSKKSDAKDACDTWEAFVKTYEPSGSCTLSNDADGEVWDPSTGI